MTTAHAPRDEAQCLDGLGDVLTRLTDTLGVTVIYEHLPEDVALWDGYTNTLRVDIDSPIDDHVCAYIECWKYLAIGDHATEWAESVERHLRAV